MKATALAPAWLRTPACLAILRGLDRGESLLVPGCLARCDAVEVLARIARMVGARVVLGAPVEQICTAATA